MINLPQQAYRASRCNYIFLCSVEADGTFDLGPETWTVEKTGTGLYTVHHDVGHVKFFATVVCGAGDYKTTGVVQSHDEHNIVVATFSSTQPADLAFDLLVITPQ